MPLAQKPAISDSISYIRNWDLKHVKNLVQGQDGNLLLELESASHEAQICAQGHFLHLSKQRLEFVILSSCTGLLSGLLTDCITEKGNMQCAAPSGSSLLGLLL